MFAIALTDSVHDFWAQKVPSKVAEYLKKVSFVPNFLLSAVTKYDPEATFLYLVMERTLTVVILQNVMFCEYLLKSFHINLWCMFLEREKNNLWYFLSL